MCECACMCECALVPLPHCRNCHLSSSLLASFSSTCVTSNHGALPYILPWGGLFAMLLMQGDDGSEEGQVAFTRCMCRSGHCLYTVCAGYPLSVYQQNRFFLVKAYGALCSVLCRWIRKIRLALRRCILLQLLVMWGQSGFSSEMDTTFMRKTS